MPDAPADLRHYVMSVLGSRLPSYIIGLRTTQWTVADISQDEWERLHWVLRIISEIQTGPYPWGDVTIRTWFMGMNPRLGDDGHNNPATFIREGRGEEVLRAAKGDYFDGSMGA